MCYHLNNDTKGVCSSDYHHDMQSVVKILRLDAPCRSEVSLDFSASVAHRPVAVEVAYVLFLRGWLCTLESQTQVKHYNHSFPHVIFPIFP